MTFDWKIKDTNFASIIASRLSLASSHRRWGVALRSHLCNAAAVCFASLMQLLQNVHYAPPKAAFVNCFAQYRKFV